MYHPNDTMSTNLFPCIPRRIIHDGPCAYAMYLDDEEELIGYAPTFTDAERTLNEIVFEQMAQGLRPGYLTLALEHEAILETTSLPLRCGRAA